jgi:lipopolysaccharide export system permease protein
LTLHNRFAYPLAGIPAALLAVGLALRPSRKGHYTTALVESLIVALVLWGMMVISKTLVLTGRIAAGPAAWAPVVLLLLVAGGIWLQLEGFWPRKSV